MTLQRQILCRPPSPIRAPLLFDRRRTSRDRLNDDLIDFIAVKLAFFGQGVGHSQQNIDIAAKYRCSLALSKKRSAHQHPMHGVV